MSTPLLLLLLLTAACGTSTVAPEDKLEPVAESAHFAYYSSNDDPDDIDTAYQERHYVWAMAGLELSYPQKIVYLKYRNRAHLERSTGRITNGFAEPEHGRFHSIWPLDNHEYIHVVFASLVGLPPSLFTEGVAVAHHGASISGELDGPPLWNGVSVHEIARQMLVAGTLPELDQLAETSVFHSLDDQKTYPIAGSFVRYLIDQHGIDAFKSFAASSEHGDRLDEIEVDFGAVYDATLQSSWADWQTFLVSSAP